MNISSQMHTGASDTGSQLHELPPVPSDKTAAAMFTAHRVNDISNELAHAEERMQVMRGASRDLRHYHNLHFDNHLRAAMTQADLLKGNMLAHYPAEAAEWKALNIVMDLASGYTLNKRSGMISLDLPPGTVAQVPGGVDDHHVTVVYLGPDVDDEAYAEACRRAQDAASAIPGPINGTVGGIGTFKPSGGSDGKTVAWTGAVLPGADQLRSNLQDLSASEHKDWKTHITLAYLDPGEPLPAPVPPTPVTFTHLTVHRGKDVMRYPLGGGPAVDMSVAVGPAAKAASFAHLLQTIMYDGAHARRHSTAMLADTQDKVWDFDADHAEKHLKGAHEHARKLSEHIADNYPAEAGWLKELIKKEELSNMNISDQVFDFAHDSWKTQPRDAHGRWTRSGGGTLAEHVHPEGFSLDPHTGKSPSSGYMVALPGHTHQYPDSVMKDKHQLAAAIDRFLMEEREVLDKPGVHLGGWVSDGKLWLDPSEHIADRHEAMKAGKERDQVAIWDVAGGQEIGTEGTGGSVTEHAAPSVSEHPPWLRGYARAPAQGRGPAAGGGIAEQAAGIFLAGR